MGILDRFRKQTAATPFSSDQKEETGAKKTTVKAAASKSATKTTKTTATKVAKKDEAKKDEETVIAPTKLSPRLALSSILLAHPHVSEKAARLAQGGTYVFNVPVSAEKVSIRKAVEALYKVNVVAVRTVRHEGKPVRRGRTLGARKTWKKALVTLKEGQKIDIYEGV